MSFLDGEPDGLLISRDLVRPVRTETTFRRGILHGPSRHFVGEELVHECFYIDGVRDGVCWSMPSMLMSTVERYDRGKRTGFWWYVSDGKVLRSWVYGDDILLGIDGRSVPPPPASIEVRGLLHPRSTTVIWRTSCTPPAMNRTDHCSALFDQYQVCELEPADRADCRANAREGYRRANAYQQERERRLKAS